LHGEARKKSLAWDLQKHVKEIINDAVTC